MLLLILDIVVICCGALLLVVHSEDFCAVTLVLMRLAPQLEGRKPLHEVDVMIWFI